MLRAAAIQAVIILCFLFHGQTPQSHANGLSRTDLLKNELLTRYGISLIDGGTEFWTHDQVGAVKSLMEELPRELQDARSYSKKGGPVHFLLNTQEPFPGSDRFYVSSHTPLPAPLVLEGIQKVEDLTSEGQVLYHLLCLYDRRHGVSSRGGWLEISEWKNMPLFLYLKKKAVNQAPEAYALPFGKKNPSLDFISTAICYLLPVDSMVEESIKCRIPKKYQFLRDLFPGFESYLDRYFIQCRDCDYGLLDDVEFYDPDKGGRIEMGPVNKDTVKGFEILYATPGTGDASEIAGHLVLRIKLNNNPAAAELGVENPHDLVISFLADTEAGKEKSPLTEDDIEVLPECRKNWLNLVNNNYGESTFESIIQSLKGLSGGFLTVMDRQTLGHTIKSYTVEQDRDLLRFKLNLTADQKESLLERLHNAKKNYKSEYYFFSQNCASVLMRVVAQGIGEREIAEFSPLTSPPNTLLALMIQKGIAEPVFPSFYSSRKKGYIAQDVIKKEYSEIDRAFPMEGWPDIGDFSAKDDQTRLFAIKDLKIIAVQNPDTRRGIYRMAALVQEAEMAYSHKDLVCENYTSPITAEARRLQKEVLLQPDIAISDIRADIDRLIRAEFEDRERGAYTRGYPHTGHYTFGLGTGFYKTQYEESSQAIMLDAAFYQQEMGSRSSLAMQRGSAVDLGRASAVFDMSGQKSGRLKAWGLTCLNVRKFRDRLGRVPSFWEPGATFGLGLTVLDFEGDKDIRRSFGTVGGIEGLLSIYSFQENCNFLYASAGAEIVSDKKGEEHHWSVMVPVRMESLCTFDRMRKWQMRNEMKYSVSINDKVPDQLKLSSSLDCRLDAVMGLEVVLRLQYELKREISSFRSEGQTARETVVFTVGFRPW